ncbi:MAG: hypothetical protein R3B70_10940 [Polyangiaceae bacterium]
MSTADPAPSGAHAAAVAHVEPSPEEPPVLLAERARIAVDDIVALDDLTVTTRGDRVLFIGDVTVLFAALSGVPLLAASPPTPPPKPPPSPAKRASSPACSASAATRSPRTRTTLTPASPRWTRPSPGRCPCSTT